MRKTTLSFVLIFLLICALPAKEKLIQAHQEWLDLVSPIITKIEREVFIQLSSNREREKFIRLFWKRRDPLPDTEKNEFQQEYFERVRFADRNFGRGAVKKGSNTERGYFYLLLGPPLDRQIYATQSQLWPLELWQYKGDPRFGLPPFFYLIFFQQDGLGEYKLYSPGIDSPERLVIAGMMQNTLNRSTAHQTLKNISGELASASLSYLPSDSTISSGSLSSLNIIANIHELAEKKFSDAYARNFLYYKDFVETEYTHNYMDCHFLIKVFQNAGQDFIHWSIEPDKVNLSFYEGKYYAALQLVLRIEDAEGNVILETEENIPVSISPEDQAKFERRPMAFQDILPIIPGDYTLFFLLQNKTAKEFASFHTRLTVPDNRTETRIGPFLLYQSREMLKGSQKRKLKAFTFGGNQYIFNSRNTIDKEKRLGVFGQTSPLQNISHSSLHIDFFNLDTSEIVHSIDKQMDRILLADGISFDTGLLDISQFQPGYFRIDFTVKSASGQILAKGKEHYILTEQSAVFLPRVFSKMHPPYPNAAGLFTLASQFFKTRDFVQAQEYVKKALQMKDTFQGKVLLAQTLYAQGNFEASLKTALPVYEQTLNRETGKIIAVNHAALKDWTNALFYLEKLMKDAQEIPVLNLAAECYMNLGQPEKALPLLEKSLKLKPDQPNIKQLAEEARRTLKSPNKYVLILGGLNE
jgi:GWxTD domain-containing protein